MKSYNSLWNKFLRHHKKHRRPHLCKTCAKLLEELEAAAKREDDDHEDRSQVSGVRGSPEVGLGERMR